MRLIGLIVAVTLLTGADDARRGAEPTKPNGPAHPVVEPQSTETDERIVRLQDALADSGTKIRRAAISELVDIGGEEAESLLATTALHHEDPSHRVEAVLGLGEIGGQASIRILEDALLDADPEVCAAAMAAVIDIGGENLAWTLAIALNSDDVTLRQGAVYALGEIGGEHAIVLLRQALADEESSIRAAAAEVLAELGQESPAAVDDF